MSERSEFLPLESDSAAAKSQIPDPQSVSESAKGLLKGYPRLFEVTQVTVEIGGVEQDSGLGMPETQLAVDGQSLLIGCLSFFDPSLVRAQGTEVADGHGLALAVAHFAVQEQDVLLSEGGKRLGQIAQQAKLGRIGRKLRRLRIGVLTRKPIAQRRLQAVQGIPSLPLTDDVGRIVPVYEARLGLASNARVDILHLALAVTYEIEYLVTWNLTHLANAVIIRRLHTELGVFTPLIVTPEELGPTCPRSNMLTEPAVEELHRIREQMLAECGGDLNQLIESLRASERDRPERMARPAPPRSWSLPRVEPEPAG